MSNNQTSNQSEFYVSKNETQQGPFSIQEIAVKVAASEFAVTDFVFDDVKADWVPLFECEAFKAHLAQSKPKAAPPKKSVTVAPVQTETPLSPFEVKAETKAALHAVQTSAKAVEPTTAKPVKAEGGDWFVQKGAHRYGPFTYLGVVRALQEKTIYEFDLVCKNGQTEWVRIAEHEEFTPEKIEALATQIASEPGIFQQRQHKRVRFESEVIVHDNRNVWLGRAFEGSAGGSGLVIENATLVPGQTVLLHFSATGELPSFNALCEIVGKKFVKEIRDQKSPVQYNVRFLKMDDRTAPKVQKIF